MSFLNPVNKSLCLEQLCEANFQKLFTLIPELASARISAVGMASGQTTLYLKIIEQTPYTMTIELTHSFSKTLEESLLPAVVVRLYLDLKLAEVLSDHARPSVRLTFKDAGLCREIMNYKWRLNYFLHKWLEHCLKKQYLFNVQNLTAKTA